jgi:SAM-dependent methyltransferase
MPNDSSQTASGLSGVLDFTGERYTPETEGNIYLEHMHRYVLVRDLINDRDVLDIASGEGFGSADMAKRARSVIGVDIDPASVAHAQGRYRARNLEFRIGSCNAIPLDDNSVDVVVSYETIEHHDQHEVMMQEIRRVLRPGGVIVISSPEKHEYTDVPGTRNPYHVKELYRHEFEALLKAHFANVAIYGQRVIFGSGLFLEGLESRTKTINAQTLEQADGLMRPTYLIAVASDAKLPQLPASSIFEADVLKSEVVTVERNGLEQTVELLQSEIRARDLRVSTLEDFVHRQDAFVKAVQRTVSWRFTLPLRVVVQALLGVVAPEKREKRRRKLTPPMPLETAPHMLPVRVGQRAIPETEEPDISLLFPIGHFYSPIADPTLIAARKAEIFRKRNGSVGIDYKVDKQLSLLATLAPHARLIDYPVEDPGDGLTYFYNNDQFPVLDAEFLHAALCHFRPAQMIEVGSGFSSLITANVNRKFLNGELRFTCIEPYPRQFLIDGVEGITDLIVSKVEDLGIEFFDRLGDGDILFIGSSHVSKVGSDVNYLFFEVIPRLNPGVIVHVHDIFLPDEYPEAWVLDQNRNWNEQYLLHAFLQFNSDWEVLWASHLMGTRHPDAVTGVFARYPRLGGGGSLWMRRRS